MGPTVSSSRRSIGTARPLRSSPSQGTRRSRAHRLTTVSTTSPAPPEKRSSGTKPQPSFRAHLRRKTAIVTRWLHIYLSMASFAVVLFFAVTGLTLNHADWFANTEKTIRSTSQMPHEWLRVPNRDDPAKLEIVEYLRTANKLHGAVSDFRVEGNQISVSFKAPGYTADA